jgi:transposase
MFGWGGATRIYLAAGATDMRKGFEGLYGIARDRLLCDPLSGHVFLFANAQRNRLGLPRLVRQTVKTLLTVR